MCNDQFDPYIFLYDYMISYLFYINKYLIQTLGFIKFHDELDKYSTHTILLFIYQKKKFFHLLSFYKN